MGGLLILNRDEHDNFRSGMHDEEFGEVRSQMRSHYRSGYRGDYRTNRRDEKSEELCEAYKKGYKHAIEDMERELKGHVGMEEDGFRRYRHG